MGLFFDYFKKTLRFPLIWREGHLSLLVRGGAASLDQAREDVLSCRTQAMPETCDLENLARIGEGRGIRQWPHEPDEFFRNRVRYAFKFFKMGGKRSGLQEILRMAGISVEILEPKQVRTALDAIEHSNLDGTWILDGTRPLESVLALTGMPELEWAEFAVRIDFSVFHDDTQHDFMKRLVYEYKPARSMPKFNYFLDFSLFPTSVDLNHMAWATSSHITRPLACPTRLDGSWRLGRPEEIITLDGSWNLDGFFKLGQVLQPALVERQVIDCHIHTRGSGGGIAAVPAGFPETITEPDFSLACKPLHGEIRLDGTWNLSGEQNLERRIVLGGSRKLDGTWFLQPGRKLGGAWPLDGSWRLDEDARPDGPVGIYKLDGTRKIGPRTPESVTWPQARGIISGATASLVSGTVVRTAGCGNGSSSSPVFVGTPGQVTAQPYIKLAYKPQPAPGSPLDGTWRLDGATQLAPGATLGGSRNLDGTWNLDLVHSELVPRQGEHKLDGTWKLGEVLPETRVWPIVR